MWKLVFASVVWLGIALAVFFIGYVLGTTVTPLPPAEPGAAAALAVVGHG